MIECAAQYAHAAEAAFPIRGYVDAAGGAGLLTVMPPDLLARCVTDFGVWNLKPVR